MCRPGAPALLLKCGFKNHPKDGGEIRASFVQHNLYLLKRNKDEMFQGQRKLREFALCPEPGTEKQESLPAAEAEGNFLTSSSQGTWFFQNRDIPTEGSKNALGIAINCFLVGNLAAFLSFSHLWSAKRCQVPPSLSQLLYGLLQSLHPCSGSSTGIAASPATAKAGLLMKFYDY